VIYRRLICLGLGVVLAACGSYADPRPPLKLLPPEPPLLIVDQRGTDAILQFETMSPTVMSADDELVELDRIEILLFEQRYPALTSQVLILALDRERRERREAAELAVASAEEAAVRREQDAELAAAIAAAVAAGEEPPVAEEVADDEADPVDPDDLLTEEELALRRVPSTIRSAWSEGEIFPGTALEAAQDLEVAVNDLWDYLGMPTAIVDITRTPRLPDPARVLEASEVVAETRDYEEPVELGTFNDFAEVIATIPIEELNNYVDGGIVRFVYPVGTPSVEGVRTRYFFGVRAVTTRNRESPVQRIVALAPVPVPAPPPVVRAEVIAEGVYLSWDAPVTDVLGRELGADAVDYDVYRRALEGPPTGATRLTLVPLRTTNFVDTTMVWNDPYVYEVRATLRPATLEDPDTAPIEDPDLIVPVPVPVTDATASVPRPRKESVGAATDEFRVTDLFAPAAVLKLTGVRAGSRVTLSWSAAVDLDLLGYRVYRHAAPAPVLPEPLPGFTYPGALPPEPVLVEGEGVVAPVEEEVGGRRQLRNRLLRDGWEMLTPVVISENRFIDPIVDDSIGWVYVVESVDTSGNVSLATSTTVVPEEES
jgi:hypothetical protein